MINSQSGVYSFKDKEQVLRNKIIFIGRKKMSPQTKYRDEIIKELEDIPDEEELLNNHAKLITTNYVVVETINALSKVEFRKSVIEFIDKLED